MPWWHRLNSRIVSVPLTFADDFLVAAFGHPACARQVRVMDETTALRIEIGIEAEQNLHRLAPVGAVARGVEQAQIQRHVLAVIGRQRLTGRRFIQKLWRGVSHRGILFACRDPVNQIHCCH